jgi:hypothetical protein
MTISYELKNGSHESREAGMCAMEWVAYLAGEEHTDSPVCVDPPLRSFGISLNDNWDDEQRQKLRPYLARCIGTAGDGRTEERGWLAMDWLIREFTPAFLQLKPELHHHAEALRAAPPVLAPYELDKAMVLLKGAQGDAARDAARVVVWDTARVAVWDAASDAARDAARVAVCDAASDAARDAARVVVWDAASVAARVAAWDAASFAAWDAASDAASVAALDAASVAALDAASVAARDALTPTVTRLRASVLDLFDRMLPTETIELSDPVQQEYAELCRA